MSHTGSGTYDTGPGGYWTGTSSYTWPYTWNSSIPTWPEPAASRPPMAIGWKCTDCGTVIAPWISEHTCPPAATCTTTVTMNTNTAGTIFKTGSHDDGETEVTPGCE